jgi:hypothetical protein
VDGSRRDSDPIHVEVLDEPSKLAELARGVPSAIRRRPIWIRLGHVALALLPSPLLLIAFSLPIVAAIGSAVAVFIGLITLATDQDVPTAGLTPGRVTVDEHGVTIERETQTDHWRGSAIRDVQLLRDAIVLLSHRDGWLVIPRASFDSPDSCDRFVTAVGSHARLGAAAPTSSWPKRPRLHFGVITFLLACAGGLAWLAFDANFGVRLVCAPLAGACFTLATADMNPRSRRLMGRKPGRPTPPRPGSTVDAYLAAVRIEELRPSGLLVLGLDGLAAALLYVTLVAGMIGTMMFVSLALLVLAFATFELSSVFEMWWPSRPIRSWRQIEVTSLGVVRRHANGDSTVTWPKLAEPIVRDGAILLNRLGGESFEIIRETDFAQPQDWDAFKTALARFA